MNDVCPKCRKPLKPGVIRPHPIRVDLAVHSFECANCGAVKTKVLFQKQSKVATMA
jgi:RNase P subunit RPR2